MARRGFIGQLQGMFPELSTEVLSAVLQTKKNNIPDTIDALLALNDTSTPHAEEEDDESYREIPDPPSLADYYNAGKVSTHPKSRLVIRHKKTHKRKRDRRLRRAHLAANEDKKKKVHWRSLPINVMVNDNYSTLEFLPKAEHHEDSPPEVEQAAAGPSSVAGAEPVAADPSDSYQLLQPVEQEMQVFTSSPPHDAVDDFGEAEERQDNPVLFDYDPSSVLYLPQPPAEEGDGEDWEQIDGETAAADDADEEVELEVFTECLPADVSVFPEEVAADDEYYTFEEWCELRNLQPEDGIIEANDADREWVSIGEAYVSENELEKSFICPPDDSLSVSASEELWHALVNKISREKEDVAISCSAEIEREIGEEAEDPQRAIATTADSQDCSSSFIIDDYGTSSSIIGSVDISELCANSEREAEEDEQEQEDVASSQYSEEEEVIEEEEVQLHAEEEATEYVAFKVYRRHVAEDSADIHRLSLPVSDYMFDDLVATIQRALKIEDADSFGVKYKDEEGDFVRVGTQEELMEALRVHERFIWPQDESEASKIVRLHVA